ncbi:GNAT family N-acetyltransferase [Kitasatospora cineracea]
MLHHSTWLTGQVCYLEDLFVDPAHRGLGAGRLLLQDLFDLATARGWARVHWLTAHDNPARHLYDTFVPADRFIHYERDLPRDDGTAPAAADRPERRPRAGRSSRTISSDLSGRPAATGAGRPPSSWTGRGAERAGWRPFRAGGAVLRSASSESSATTRSSTSTAGDRRSMAKAGRAPSGP